jgi:hypothetical protein
MQRISGKHIVLYDSAAWDYPSTRRGLDEVHLQHSKLPTHTTVARIEGVAV